MSIHNGNPETSERCRSVYNYLVACGARGATSIELAHAGNRQQVAVGTTVSELRAWARKEGNGLTFPCKYEGQQDGRKVYRYFTKDYGDTAITSPAIQRAGYSWDGDQAVLA
jgi:hypothetical protein